MKNSLVLAAGLFVGLAAMNVTGTFAQGSRPTVFLDAEGELANDFLNAVIRKNIPVTLTTDGRQAGYVVRFTLATKKGSKTRGVLTAVILGVYLSGAYTRVSMSVTERKSKNVIYSDTCETGGRHMRSFADCLAKHWKKSLASNRSDTNVESGLLIGSETHLNRMRAVWYDQCDGHTAGRRLLPAVQEVNLGEVGEKVYVARRHCEGEKC